MQIRDTELNLNLQIIICTITVLEMGSQCFPENRGKSLHFSNIVYKDKYSWFRAKLPLLRSCPSERGGR